MKRTWILMLVLFASCQKQQPVADKPHDHEPHAESYTHWTPQTELFAEYLPLVAGQTSRFAVHLTRLDSFKPVAEGVVEIRLTSASGVTQTYRVDASSRPGIFGIDVKPTAVGPYQIAVHLTSRSLSAIHELGTIEVSATATAHDHEDSEINVVTFLKEQQWTLDFATAAVEDRRLRASLRVPAEVLPRSGGEAEVTAPFDGRLVGSDLPILGSRVTQGQRLVSLLPPTSTPSDLTSLELARNEATIALQLARKDRERAERLVESGAAPAKRLDEARTVEATVEARLRAADVRLAQYEASSSADADPRGAKLFALRAPINGVIVEAATAPGANVRSGEPLFKIVDADTVYVSAIVPESELPQIRNLTGAELEGSPADPPRPLTRLISIGRVVDPQSRTLPVIYQVDNRDRRIAIHQSVQVRLLTRPSQLGPAVPESALVDDGGRPVVFVQSSGETFVRRPVKLGVREGGLVEVVEGVSRGERIVVKGAHLVRLASMATQVPAEGHVH
jgi:RND family efflux transporter MFP subunit